MLEIPDLHRAPRSRTVYGDSPIAAQAALAFLSTPFGATAAKSSSAAGVIHAALRAWLDAFTLMPPTREPNQPLANVLRRHIVYALRAEYWEPESGGGIRLDLDATLNASTVFAVSQRLKAAEIYRGLGQSALVSLARASDVSIPILLPQTLFQMARGRKYLKARLKNFPDWVADPQPLERATLVGLANPKRTRFTGRLARAILALDQAVAAARAIDMPKRRLLVQFPLALTWEPVLNWDSAYRQILDDWSHDHDRDLVTIFSLEAKAGPQLASALGRFMKAIAATGPVLQAVTTLVAELAKGGKSDD